MSVYGGFNFTGFSGVNLKNTAAIRFGLSGSDVSGTLSVQSDDESGRSWRFPAKSGAFPISGTFTVNVPAYSASDIQSTIVTVAGIRTEDGLTCVPMTAISGTALVYYGATPGNGQITVRFSNPFGVSTAKDIVMGYTAVR